MYKATQLLWGWLLLWLLLLAAGAVAPRAWAQARIAAAPQQAPGLRVEEFALGADPLQVGTGSQAGRPFLYARAQKNLEGQPRIHFLYQLSHGGEQGWRQERWDLPELMSYVEPWPLPSGEIGWLGLREGGLYLGRVQADGSSSALRWSELCECPTIFKAGGRPDFRQQRLLHDLDGDGVSEVLLPLPEHLAAYRILLGRQGHTMQPLWRAPWTLEGKPLEPIPAQNAGYPLPVFDVRSLGAKGGDSRRALVIRGDEHLLVAPLPPAVAGTAPSAEPLTPYRVEFPTLGTVTAEDRLQLLALEDMDGDGLPDVLHAKMLNYGSVFSQQNELRWFRGALEDGKLTLIRQGPTQRYASGSFAELLWPTADGRPPLALLLATTEVTFGTVMKALATQRVTLNAQIFHWQSGGLGSQPVTQAEFTYHALREKGRRAMFLLADLDGDGRRDYVLNLQPTEISVYHALGRADDLAAAVPWLMLKGTPLPARPERVSVLDLDGDGREALWLWYEHRFQPETHHALWRITLAD